MPFFLCMTFDLKTINRKEQKAISDQVTAALWRTGFCLGMSCLCFQVPTSSFP